MAREITFAPINPPLPAFTPETATRYWFEVSVNRQRDFRPEQLTFALAAAGVDMTKTRHPDLLAVAQPIVMAGHKQNIHGGIDRIYSQAMIEASLHGLQILGATKDEVNTVRLELAAYASANPSTVSSAPTVTQ